MNTFHSKLICYSFLFISLAFIISCSREKKINILVTNPNEANVSDAFVSVEIDSNLSSFSLFNGKDEIPYQVLNLKGKKEIGFVLNLNPMESKVVTVKADNENQVRQFKPRTYAELSMKPVNTYFDGKFHGERFEKVTKIKVPEIHTDHDALFKYEGPGWESDRVGYRFYLDWRNANDIFGKKVSELVLANVGIHDTVAKDDSYHKMQEWGMDIFKVGNSLGIGSIGMWYDGKVNMVSETDSVFCEISENGPIRSKVKTSYFGWKVGENKYNLVSCLSITAGSRLTKCEVEITDNADNIVTGLAKYEGTNLIKMEDQSEWGYLALYGNQTLVSPDDKLGIAIFYRNDNLLSVTEDELSHIVKLKPEDGFEEYYFCAAWEQEPGGFKNEKEFIDYLDHTIIHLNNPILIELN